jgi:hypothetical protein
VNANWRGRGKNESVMKEKEKSGSGRRERKRRNEKEKTASVRSGKYEREKRGGRKRGTGTGTMTERSGGITEVEENTGVVKTRIDEGVKTSNTANHPLATKMTRREKNPVVDETKVEAPEGPDRTSTNLHHLPLLR